MFQVYSLHILQVSLSIPKLEEKVKSYCEQLDMSLEELSDAAKELSNLGSGEASNGNFTIHKSCNQNHEATATSVVDKILLVLRVKKHMWSISSVFALKSLGRGLIPGVACL